MTPGGRLVRSICAIALFACCVPLFYGDAQATPASKPLLAHALGKGTIPLDGPWQFHLGDDIAWANPGFDDSRWEQLGADRPWGEQGHRSYTGFAWYRRQISITPASGASPDIALLVPKVDDAYEIYWNGVRVAHNGKMPPNPVWYFSQPAQTFGLGRTTSGVLAVRVWKAPPASSDSGTDGGFEGSPILGLSEAIAASKDSNDYQWLRKQQFFFCMSSLYFLAGLLSLLSWLRDRSEWLLFWMAGFCLGPLLVLILFALRIPWHWGFAMGMAQPCFAITLISLCYLLLWLLQLNDVRPLVRWVKIASLVDITAMSLDGMLLTFDWTSPVLVRPVQIADVVLTAIFTPYGLLPLVLVGYAVVRRRRLDPAAWLVATIAFLSIMVPVVGLAAAQGRRYTHWRLDEKLTGPLFTINGNPFNAPGIGQTLLFVSIVYAVYHFSVANLRRKNALEQEFKSARELQESLIPVTLPPVPGFALTSAYRPAFEVGGDFFQIIPMDGDSTLVILGDVSGKGLKAAMTVSLIVGAARMAAETASRPAEILAALNRRLYGRMQGGFVTCIALWLNADGSGSIATAGHPAPFLNDQETGLSGTLPLGLLSAATYEESTLRLKAGDHLALYTDGLLEARSSSGELFSFDRLAALFATRPTAEQATHAAVAFGQEDDITILILTRLGIGDGSTEEIPTRILAPI
jgi:hypothetical protein